MRCSKQLGVIGLFVKSISSLSFEGNPKNYLYCTEVRPSDPHRPYYITKKSKLLLLPNWEIKNLLTV